jgi:hypothetical protein
MKVNEIINLAMRHKEDIKDDKELQKILEKTGMSIEEFDMAVLIGGFMGDFEWLEEKLKDEES